MSETVLGMRIIVSDALPIDQALLVSENVQAGKPPHVLLIQNVGTAPRAKEKP